MTRTACSLLIATVLLVGIGSLAWSQAPTFDLDWDNSTLSAALEQLGRAFGVQYTLPADLGAKKLTVHRKGVTLAEAMQELAKAAGVRVLADPSGKFVFQPTQTAGGTQTAGWQQNQPANPWATPGAAYGGAPAPVRPGQPAGTPAMPAAPTMPGMGGGMPAMGGFGAMGGQAGAFGGRVTLPNGQTGIMTIGGEVVDPSEVALRILELQHMSPELVAMLFGGYPVYDVGSSSSYGGGGGYGTSGYGTSNQYGGNSGYGTSRSNRNSGYNSGNTGYNTGTTGRSSRSSNRSSY